MCFIVVAVFLFFVKRSKAGPFFVPLGVEVYPPLRQQQGLARYKLLFSAVRVIQHKCQVQEFVATIVGAIPPRLSLKLNWRPRPRIQDNMMKKNVKIARKG